MPWGPITGRLYLGFGLNVVTMFAIANTAARRARTRASVIGLLVLAGFLFLPVGSVDDRVVVICGGLLTKVRWVRSSLKRVQARFGAVAVHCILLTIVCVVWAWGNARFRTGGGPLHIVESGTWRGYPFVFESWAASDAGLITVWRDFHFPGLIGDIAVFIAACIVLTWWMRPPRFSPVLWFLSLASGGFVWLNVEPWVFGAPLIFIGPPPPAPPERILQFTSAITYGFPWVMADLNSTGLRAWPLAGNVIVGCASWISLFASRFRSGV